MRGAYRWPSTLSATPGSGIQAHMHASVRRGLHRSLLGPTL